MKNVAAGTRLVVVFFGLIGSGKSFVAKAWAAQHGFPYCNTDVVRTQLAATKACAPSVEGVSEGKYSQAFTRRTYDALLDFADRALADPAVTCVVLDGSYQAQTERQTLVQRLAPRARVVFVLCSWREPVIKTRLAQRALDPAAVSDGTWQIYLRQKKVFEYPEELSVWQFRRLETDKGLNLLLESLEELLQDESGGGEESS